MKSPGAHQPAQAGCVIGRREKELFVFGNDRLLVRLGHEFKPDVEPKKRS
jgi:hypothetical protein